MDKQKRSDLRSKALHKAIAQKLRSDPSLWDIPKYNIMKWNKNRRQPIVAYLEWDQILNTNSKEQILLILESDSEESTRLRSSTPFTGILTENERKKIFELFRVKS